MAIYHQTRAGTVGGCCRNIIAFCLKFMRRPVRVLSCVAFFSVALTQFVRPSAADAPDRVFTERLKALGGVHAADCGATSSARPDISVATCGLKAFQEHKPFFLGYYTHYGKELDFAYGLAGNANGNVFAVSYQTRAFPSVAPTKHTKLLDDNHTRVT